MHTKVRKRTLIPILIALAVIAAMGVALYLRAKAPPEAARLLPESDAIIYVHLKSLRAATHFDQTPVKRSAYFQHFIDATGIVPERDIDEAAFALHRMPNPKGPNGPVAYSEVFVGRFDGVRLAKYLVSIASEQETYAGRTIYDIPIDGRTLRVAQLGYDTIGASNMPTPEQIHSMLDRARTSALGTPGSSLLAARYKDVPLLSEAWGVGNIGLPFAQSGHLSILGIDVPLAANTDLVASLRYSGSVHLRVEELAPSADAARHTVDALTTLLNILRGIGAAGPANNPSNVAMRQVLNSITLVQHQDHAVLNATATIDQMKALTSAKSLDTDNAPDENPITTATGAASSDTTSSDTTPSK